MVGTRHSNFWDRVVKEGVGLITTLECGVSKVTQEEAAEVGPTLEITPAHSSLLKWDHSFKFTLSFLSRSYFCDSYFLSFWRLPLSRRLPPHPQ